MLRLCLVTVVAAALAGCSSNTLKAPYSGTESEQRAQLAAYAASTPFPEGNASDDLSMGVLVDRKNNTVTLLNFGDQPIRDANVWINGSFVRKVMNIPANGKIVLPRSSFYDASGTSLQSVETSTNRVQLQTSEHFYNLKGPVYE